MVLDPALFESALPEWADRWPDKGERVRFQRKAHFQRATAIGTGEVRCVWLGIEVTVDLDDDTSFCPALGDRYWIEPDWSDPAEVLKALTVMTADDPEFCKEHGMLTGARPVEILKMWFGR